MGYFDRYAHFKTSLIGEPIHPSTDLCIVIPCHNEPDIESTLNSLKACIEPSSPVEIIIVINASEKATASVAQQNIQTENTILNWVETHAPPWLQVHVIHKTLPQKHAGVGLARKIGMDEAARRFESVDKNGAIVALDADCAVAPNYLKVLESEFAHSQNNAAGIRFEHPLNHHHAEEIINYELHLRYFINAQRWSGFPHAYQTVGSSMAVKSKMYQKVGGMPKKQAGEDFYFLHKVIPLGGFTEINETIVYPSPRISDRVPFGTGRDIGMQKNDPRPDYRTYNFESFKDLKIFLNSISGLYNTGGAPETGRYPASVRAFLRAVEFETKLHEIRSNSASPETFLKRFYNWFDAFTVMKYCHFLRHHFYSNEEVLSQTNRLLPCLNLPAASSKKEALLILRDHDRQR